MNATRKEMQEIAYRNNQYIPTAGPDADRWAELQALELEGDRQLEEDMQIPEDWN